MENTSTVKLTLSAIRALGMSSTYRDGEFRVDYLKSDPRWSKESAYFTNDRSDAFGTADAMRKFRE